MCHKQVMPSQGSTRLAQESEPNHTLHTKVSKCRNLVDARLSKMGKNFFLDSNKVFNHILSHN